MRFMKSTKSYLSKKQALRRKNLAVLTTALKLSSEISNSRFHFLRIYRARPQFLELEKFEKFHATEQTSSAAPFARFRINRLYFVKLASTAIKKEKKTVARSLSVFGSQQIVQPAASKNVL